MREIPISLEGVSVFVAMPTHRAIEIEVNMSLQEAWKTCIERNMSVEFHTQDGGSDVFCSRNWALWDFLKKDYNRLFWWDSDIRASAKDFMRLIAFSTELDVVGAAYRMKSEPPRYCQSPQLKGGDVLQTNRFGCFKSDGFGLGFCCVNRKVIDALVAKAPRIMAGEQVGPGVFHSELVASDRAKELGVLEYQGEDMTFFADARNAGFDVWLDPTIRLGHVGKKVYEGAFQDLLVRPNGTDSSTSP